MLYRYGPRPILEGDVNGGKPVVHFAVVERMLFGCDDYAPIMLPANARVLMPDGNIRELTNDGAHQAMHDAYAKKARRPISKEESDAFTGMKAPDADMANLARGAVWWRRVAYFSLLIMTGVIAAWPWIAHKIIDTSGKSLRDFVSNIDWGFSAILGSVANLLKNVLPSYAGPWLNIALYYPVATSLVVLVTWWVWSINASLRDGIQERARLAWYAAGTEGERKKPQPDELVVQVWRFDAAKCAVDELSVHQDHLSRRLHRRHLRRGLADRLEQLLHLARRDRTGL
ncbi:hypothetical protein ABIF72_007680 [Bradyrhizobium japonicum]